MTVQATQPAVSKGSSGGGARRTPSAASLSNLIRRPEAGSLIATIAIFIFFAMAGGAKFTAASGTAT